MQFTGFKQAKLNRLGSEELHTLRRVACRSFGPRRLIVYTKPDCPLCDGLKVWQNARDNCMDCNISTGIDLKLSMFGLGRQDKVSGLIARAQFMPSILTEYILEIRDVSEREEWSSAFAGEVPVLAAELDGVQVSEERFSSLESIGCHFIYNFYVDTCQVKLPRPPPRITAERLQQHIEMALKSNGQP